LLNDILTEYCPAGRRTGGLPLSGPKSGKTYGWSEQSSTGKTDSSQRKEICVALASNAERCEGYQGTQLSQGWRMTIRLSALKSFDDH